MQSVENLTGVNLTKKPILNNKLNISYVRIENYTISNDYLFPNGTKSFTTGYLLAYPMVASSKIKGIVAYFHPTVFNKTAVPTSYTNEYLGIVGLYSSQGYIVLMPDYIGLGNDFRNIHPYVIFPQQNIQNMAYALTDAYPRLASRLEISTFRLFTTGYSEGAAYSLWMNVCQNSSYTCPYYSKLPEYQYKLMKTAGMDGAYNMQTQMEFLEERVSKSSV